jgi:hypothetical protein
MLTVFSSAQSRIKGWWWKMSFKFREKHHLSIIYNITPILSWSNWRNNEKMKSGEPRLEVGTSGVQIRIATGLAKLLSSKELIGNMTKV